MRLRLHCPAKVNLGLRVVGKRADGYHLLDTVFHALDLHDTLWLEDAAELGLDLVAAGGGLPVPVGEDNLVLRAARAFHAAAGVLPTGLFRLEKRVPAGGGLGGGSSNAAAALLLLEQRHGRPLGPQTLARIATELGADVPFFLRGGTQRGTGIGEVLTEVEGTPPLWFVLMVPPFGTSTAAVFRNCRVAPRPGAALPGADAPIRAEREPWNPSWLTTPWHNDLEESAAQLYPDLGQLRLALAAADLTSVSMSGSGSTMFAAFAEGAAAMAAEKHVQGLALPGVRVLLTRTAQAHVASRTPVVEGG